MTLGLKMLLSPISLTRKANVLKIGGSLGGAAIATVVLEFVAQALVKNSSQAASIGANQLPFVPAVPFIGDVTVKDAPSLIPAAAGVITLLKGRTKAGILMVVGSVGAKSALRSAGYNPDELEAKAHRLYDKYIMKRDPVLDTYNDYAEPEVYF